MLVSRCYGDFCSSQLIPLALVGLEPRLMTPPPLSLPVTSTCVSHQPHHLAALLGGHIIIRGRPRCFSAGCEQCSRQCIAPLFSCHGYSVPPHQGPETRTDAACPSLLTPPHIHTHSTAHHPTGMTRIARWPACVRTIHGRAAQDQGPCPVACRRRLTLSPISGLRARQLANGLVQSMRFTASVI